jgi:adenine-specific DNA glycosylase
LKKLEKPARQIKREIHYALDCRRNGSVFLVQRAQDESLMPGMWELPEMASREIAQARRLTRNDPANELVLRLRHSITVTQYAVRVSHVAAPAGIAGKWVVKDRIESLPLTGLARKILRAAKVI